MTRGVDGIWDKGVGLTERLICLLFCLSTISPRYRSSLGVHLRHAVPRGSIVGVGEAVHGVAKSARTMPSKRLAITLPELIETMSSREDTNDNGDQAYELVQHPSYIPTRRAQSCQNMIIVGQTAVV